MYDLSCQTSPCPNLLTCDHPIFLPSGKIPFAMWKGLIYKEKEKQNIYRKLPNGERPSVLERVSSLVWMVGRALLLFPCLGTYRKIECLMRMHLILVHNRIHFKMAKENLEKKCKFKGKTLKSRERGTVWLMIY